MSKSLRSRKTQGDESYKHGDFNRCVLHRLTGNGLYLMKTKIKKDNGKYYTLRASFPNVKMNVELEIDKKATKNHGVDVYKIKD